MQDEGAAGGGPRSRLLSPGWVALHLLVVAAVVVMARLGSWQWARGAEIDSIRNYSYGLEWWAFGLFTVAAWVKYCVDEVRPEAPEAPGAEPRRRRARTRPEPRPTPVVVVDEDEDPELAAWNRRFAERAAREAERGSR